MRRGGVLLEVLIALGLFVAAGSFAMASMRQIHASLDHAKRRAMAMDIARSRLAELEAGLVSIQELRGEYRGDAGSASRSDDGGRPARWTMDVTTRPSEFTGLSLVELTVREQPPVEGASADGLAVCTVRQLMSLGGPGAGASLGLLGEAIEGEFSAPSEEEP